MDTPIAIKEFTRKSTFPCDGYITSVDVINNIVAVTDTNNGIYVFDLYKEKEILKLKIEDKSMLSSVAEVRLLKKYKTSNESECTNEKENIKENENKEGDKEADKEGDKERNKNEKEKEKNKNENEKNENENEKNESENEKSESENEKNESENEKNESENEKSESENEKNESENEKNESENEKNESENEKNESENEKNESENEKSESENEKNESENEKNESENENEEFEIEEILIIECGEKGKKLYISHCTLNNPKILHKYIFEYGIIENGFALHPRTHIFIVTLESKELGVYNIIDKTCLYATTVQNPYCIPCFNKTGIIYACSLEPKSLHLYSSYADEYTEEYFANFDISKILENDKDYCIHMDFSYDDKKIVVVTKSHQIYTLDAFDGTILYKYIYEQDTTQPLVKPHFIPRPIFSFDSNFVISGENSSNIICVWDIKGNFICKFCCEENVSFIKWIYNRNAFIATTTSVMLWQLN